jgi:mRNA interferase MazF
MGRRRLGETQMNRGEIRWYAYQPPDKQRPVLLLTRPNVIDHINEVIVVPITRTIRGINTEVILTEEDGMPVICALNFDHIALAQQSRFGSVLTLLPEQRWSEIRKALLTACGFQD